MLACQTKLYRPAATWVLILFLGGCGGGNQPQVPHETQWGIYSLELSTREVSLIYSSAEEIFSVLRLNPAGDRLVFSQRIGGATDEQLEICSLGADGTGFRRLTNNSYWDLYPAWSPDGTKIAFLSLRQTDLDIYVMNADGSNERLLYDSGSHDADISWAGNRIAFTSGFRIWGINDDGTAPVLITNPAQAGTWGNANLPVGDYDPALSPDGTKIAFERLEDASPAHGGYNIFTINSDGSGETRLTGTGYAQGMPVWSRGGDKIVYIVAAINDQGIYHLYTINPDGTDSRDITPDYFPPGFLCHSAVFSGDDSKIYFIGQWWQ